MNKREMKDLLTEATMQIRKVYGKKLKNVILFGSYARGDYDNESDIDIMAIVDMDDKEIHILEDAIVDIDVELSIKYGVEVSIISQKFSQFVKYKDVIVD